MESARRIARRGLAGGARRDRPHVGERAPGHGLDLLVRPRAGRAGHRGRRACLLPAHFRPAELLRAAGVRGIGAMAGVPEPYYVAPENEVETAKLNPGLARALELYRLELRS